VQVATGPKTDSRLIARQILAEYGEHAAAKEQKKKKPKKNQDIVELKVIVILLSTIFLLSCK
jgi:hypothetical protein